MAEDFLEKIYQDAKLCCKIRQMVQYARSHDRIHVVEMRDDLMPQLEEVCGKCLELWEHFQELQAVADKILIGDILEGKILPLVEENIGMQGSIRVENEEGDYLFESALSGFLTIKDVKNARYLHSTVDPMWEARQLAECIYDPGKAQYAIRGCGLGYLIYQLYEYSGGSAVIHVFEKDVRMVEYAKKYGVLDWVPEENIKVVADEDPRPFLESVLEESTEMYIFEPELHSEKEDIAPILGMLAIQHDATYVKKKDIAINYWSNLKQGCRMISEFDYSHLNKDFIVAAGGPSLDDCMDFLRENQGKKTLIAVGTVFRKLLQADIIPDMVTILDSDPIVYRQVEGLEEQKVPLLLSMEVPWKIAARYQGEKYLIPVGGTKEILGLSEEAGEEVWEVGATVTDLALAAAVRFGAEKIYMAGVDMAYPSGITHAKGTLQRTKMSLEKLIPVEGVNGETVYTDLVMRLYQQQIEDRIADTPQVAWYNLSCIGAKLAGAIAIKE